MWQKQEVAAGYTVGLQGSGKKGLHLNYCEPYRIAAGKEAKGCNEAEKRSYSVVDSHSCSRSGKVELQRG